MRRRVIAAFDTVVPIETVSDGDAEAVGLVMALCMPRYR